MKKIIVIFCILISLTTYAQQQSAGRLIVTDSAATKYQKIIGLGTGLLKSTSGVLGLGTSGSDFQAPISVTTTGSGAATFIGTTLNIPVGNSGTVTTIADLSPLFIFTNRTTTPTPALSSAAAHSFFGNNTGSSATPSYAAINETDVTSLVSDLALKAPLASPVFTGVVTFPTPFTLGATSVTTTPTQLNYLNTATGVTGTGNLVLSAGSTLTGTTTASTLVSGSLTTLATATSANFASTGANGLMNATTQAQLEVWGNSLQPRALFRGSTSTVATASNDITNVLLGIVDFTTAATGTHANAANLAVMTPTRTIGTATVTNMYTAYIGDVPIGGTAKNISLSAGTLEMRQGEIITPVSKSANYTLALTDRVVIVTTGTNTQTLPTAPAGQIFTIINIGAGAVTVVGTISGATNYSLASAYKYVTVMSSGTGTTYYIIANN